MRQVQSRCPPEQIATEVVLRSAENSHAAEYFAQRSRVRPISGHMHGAAFAHHAIGWCVMRMRSGLTGFGLLVLATGCVPMPTVALDATPADLEILAGEWAGEYESAALGRRGSIEFKLKAGTNEARGDVLMVPRRPPEPYQPRLYQEGEAAADMAVDPICSRSDSSARRTVRSQACWIATGIPIARASRSPTFNGHVAAGVVEGTFKTTFDCGAGEASGHVDGNEETREAEPGMEIVMSETRDYKVVASLRARLRIRGDVSRQ